MSIQIETIGEHIRNLVDKVFEEIPNSKYTINELSDKILDIAGDNYSYRQIYDSIKELDYTNHHYTRDIGTKPYHYELMQ